MKFQLRKLNRALEICKLVLIGSGTIVYVKIVRREDLMLFFLKHIHTIYHMPNGITVYYFLLFLM